MPYDIRTSQIFVKGINTETEVVAIIKKMQKLCTDRINGSWTSEGDSATLEFGLEPDVVIGLAIKFLKTYYPNGEWGGLYTSARQIRN